MLVVTVEVENVAVLESRAAVTSNVRLAGEVAAAQTALVATSAHAIITSLMIDIVGRRAVMGSLCEVDAARAFDATALSSALSDEQTNSR